MILSLNNGRLFCNSRYAAYYGGDYDGSAWLYLLRPITGHRIHQFVINLSSICHQFCHQSVTAIIWSVLLLTRILPGAGTTSLCRTGTIRNVSRRMFCYNIKISQSEIRFPEHRKLRSFWKGLRVCAVAGGQVPIGWAIDSELSMRFPPVYKHIYDTKTPNDYFISGDSGAGCESDEFCIKYEDFVLQTRNFVSKTRESAFKMMNLQLPQPDLAHPRPGDWQARRVQHHKIRGGRLDQVEHCVVQAVRPELYRFPHQRRGGPAEQRLDRCVHQAITAIM